MYAEREHRVTDVGGAYGPHVGRNRTAESPPGLDWTREWFEAHGLYRLRGTIRYPEQPFWKGAA